jgi:pimeloyl-ACP methyl ester carboxylesterase
MLTTSLHSWSTFRLRRQRGSAAFAEDFLKRVFTPESFQRIPEEVALIRDIITRTPPLVIAGMLLALAARTDTTASLGALRIPTLILVGSTLHVVPNAGHMSPMENPGAVNRHLMEFLRTTYK